MNTSKKSLIIASLALLIGAAPAFAAEDDARARAIEAEANRASTPNELEAKKREMAAEYERAARENGAKKEAEGRARSSDTRGRPAMPSQSRPQNGGSRGGSPRR